MDRNMDAYFLTSSQMRICIVITVLPRCRCAECRMADWPGCRLPAGLLCGGDGESARRGRRGKGQGARRRASEKADGRARATNLRRKRRNERESRRRFAFAYPSAIAS